MSPSPRDPRQGQRASAEPVANPVTPPRRCPGSPRPTEVAIHHDTLITPPRPPSALGLDLSPETMAMLARFTEFDAVALDSLREEALHIAMDTEQEVPAHSSRFNSLVHRTVSPLRRQCETTTLMPTADEPVVISDDEENIPLPGMDVDPPIVTPADDPPPPYGSWEEEAPPTYEEACGLLRRRVVGSEETEGTAPVSLLGRRRRDPVAPNLSDVSEDETAPRLPARPWLNPDLDMGPSTSAEAQRRREAAAIEPTTTTGHEGITTGSSMDIEPETAEWVHAPPKWTVHTPERLLPPALVARLEEAVANRSSGGALLRILLESMELHWLLMRRLPCALLATM
ncbi:hypothetical protein ACLKA7_000823 [Drosophila subpalustris]